MSTYSVTLDDTTYSVTTSASLSVGGYATQGIYSVTAYGATGDGATDDSAAIQAAIDAAEANGGGTVYFPPGGDYYIETGLTLVPPNAVVPVVIEAYGATITALYTINAPILTIGATGTDSEQGVVRGGYWRYSSASAWGNSGNACIKLLNATRIRIYDVELRRGYYGVLLYAEDAHYCAYNETFAVEVRDCLNGIYLYCAGDDAWTNENLFMGGGIHYSSSVADASSGYAMCLMHDGASPNHYQNNNRFIDISAESAAPSGHAQYIHDEYGFWNHWSRCRSEGYGTPLMTFGANTREAFYGFGVETNAADIVGSADRKKVVIMTTSEHQLVGGTATAPTVRMFNDSGAAYPVLMIANATGATDMIRFYGDGSMRFYPVSAPAATAAEGMVYYDSDDKKLKVYNGSAWETITSST